jgi:type II secretion system protein J
MPRSAAHSNQRRAAGFTLVEIMLAAVAGAMIFAVIFGIWVNAMHMRDKANTLTEQSRMRARAANIIRSDLRNIYISGADPTTANGMAAVLNCTQQSQRSQFPGYLQFTATTAHLSDTQLGGDVQGIEYYVSKDPSSSDGRTGMLVRTETRIILASTPVQPPEEPILSGVTGLSVSFYDGNEWQDTWSYAAAGDPLPEAIKIDVLFSAPNSTSGPAPLEVIVPWEITPFIPAPTTTGTGTTSTGS